MNSRRSRKFPMKRRHVAERWTTIPVAWIRTERGISIAGMIIVRRRETSTRSLWGSPSGSVSAFSFLRSPTCKSETTHTTRPSPSYTTVNVTTSWPYTPAVPCTCPKGGTLPVNPTGTPLIYVSPLLYLIRKANVHIYVYISLHGSTSLGTQIVESGEPVQRVTACAYIYIYCGHINPHHYSLCAHIGTSPVPSSVSGIFVYSVVAWAHGWHALFTK